MTNIVIETGGAIMGKMSKICPIPQEALLGETKKPEVDTWELREGILSHLGRVYQCDLCLLSVALYQCDLCSLSVALYH